MGKTIISADGRFEELPMIISDKLTAERIAEIENMPIVYDDAPKFTKEQLAEFIPYHREYFDIKPKKVSVTLKLDADILATIKSSGDDYEGKINSLLREAVIARQF